jgi:hypothetical protein
MAVYILLTCIGWAIFLLLPGKYAMYWLAKKTGSRKSPEPFHSPFSNPLCPFTIIHTHTLRLANEKRHPEVLLVPLIRLLIAFWAVFSRHAYHHHSRKRTNLIFHDRGHVDHARICLFHRYDWCTCYFWYVACVFCLDAMGRALRHQCHNPLVLGFNGSSSIMFLGAFMTGLIVPREGGLTIALTEKLEDMVAIIFLPLVRWCP